MISPPVSSYFLSRMNEHHALKKEEEQKGGKREIVGRGSKNNNTHIQIKNVPLSITTTVSYSYYTTLYHSFILD